MYRDASPPGASTLMTSAPRSASTCPASGPATFWVKSSTRNPSSGLAGLLFGLLFGILGPPLTGLVQYSRAVVVLSEGRCVTAWLQRQSVVGQQLIHPGANRVPAAVLQIGCRVVALAGVAKVFKFDV